MTEIALTHDLVALVDDADLPLLSQWRWYAEKPKGPTYARSTVWENGRTRSIYMHRVIMDEPVGLVIDHINGNGLDNRRKNLRAISHTENLWNRRSKAVGVSQRRGAWRAFIDHCGEKWEIGQYRDEATALAARAYVQAILRSEPVRPRFDSLLLAPKIKQLIDSLTGGAP